MTTALRLALAALALVLLLGVGVWYYLFGPNNVDAAQLVPRDTVIFATIPNAAKITVDYQTSHLKQLIDAPEAKPVLDTISHFVGQKNLTLLLAFLPNLSGQSFIAVTHFDPDQFGKTGLIAGFKPKPGVDSFNSFIDQLKAAYPDVLAQGTTGAGQVDGLDYQWIQGPGAPDKICVARYRGWIVTAWGEAALQDWWDRITKKSTASSLKDNPDYQKSLERVGKDSEAILYVDYHAVLAGLQNQMAARHPAIAQYFSTKWQSIGALAVGTSFEHGEIADHFSVLLPRAAQADFGMVTSPAPFDTLKFTSPDTRFYWGGNLDWSQIWKNLSDLASQSPGDAGGWVPFVQNWAQSKNLDVQRNIIGPLGHEFSVQAEWSEDTAWPEVGLFVKLDKPDDFKPAVAAFIESIRETYSTSAVINEINSGGQNFATIKFVQPLPVSPTITEDGPYLGVFLTENQAVRSFQRDASVGLLNNADFKSQIGDRQNGASQLIFLDTPKFADRAYQTALPYLSLISMFNRTLSTALQGQTLPPNLQWLAPIDTWSFVSSSDDDGIKAYSISGIGDQGVYLMHGLGQAFFFMPPWMHAMVEPPAVQPPVPPAPSPAMVPPPDTNTAPNPAAPAMAPADAPTNSTAVPSDAAPPASSPAHT